MMTTRGALVSEHDAVCSILAAAFSTDPVWGSWAFPDDPDPTARLQEFWRPFVVAADKYDGVVVTDDLAAVSIWVPPGRDELDEDDERDVAQMAERVCGARLPVMNAGWEEFGRSRPEQPHWYLSLLATAPGQRGRGVGMALVEAQLSRVDAEGLPAYLESTNTNNVSRYERAGFLLDGYFTLPDGPRVDRMWREPVRQALS